MSPYDARREYEVGELDEHDVDPDPLVQFRSWIASAAADPRIDEPNAMTLATATGDGRPSARIVLLRDVDDRGFVFYTNRASRKGLELASNPRAALVFHWAPQERQVRVEGTAELVDDDASDRYFASRPRRSRLGALASAQSAVIASRAELEARMTELEIAYPEGVPVPRPASWGGYRVVPDELELWQGRRSRLHDRVRYRRAGGSWALERLAP